MIRSDRVLDPALQELNDKVMRINRYKMDFAEFTVAWVISNRVNRAKSARIKHYTDSVNFGNFTTGYTEP